MIYDLIVLGGGAAGIFGAISAKEAYPSSKVLVLEKTATLLAKVRISGGGRCNVTHALFDPNILSQNYPRGSKELIGPFHRFGPKEMIGWLESKGVSLKTEEDGRMFPVSNQSETIIQTLLETAQKLKVEIKIKVKVASLTKENDLFVLKIENESIKTRNILLATGSSKEGQEIATDLGHTIVPSVPSLFTFNIPNSPLKELSGISLHQVKLTLNGSSFTSTGPLLITHFGFSGPSVLKLSAFGARYLYENHYDLPLFINWLPSLSENRIYEALIQCKSLASEKTLLTENPFKFPKNLWKVFLESIGDSLFRKNYNLPLKDLRALAHKLQRDEYRIQGKTTHKEEFVTAGGICLKEIDFKRLESKITPGLFFAGEILNIDGITGGFNFQNAWTTSYIAGNSIHMVD